MAAQQKALMSCLPKAFAGLTLLAGLSPQMPLLAQGLDDSKAVDLIVGSDVGTERESAADNREELFAAIKNTPNSISEVRKSFSLDRVEIVFLPDYSESDQVVTIVQEHQPEIDSLRSAIEGNAMFYHAVNSRSVALDNIIAVDFDKRHGATIYAAGDQP